jgi:hypothetical protein
MELERDALERGEEGHEAARRATPVECAFSPSA